MKTPNLFLTVLLIMMSLSAKITAQDDSFEKIKSIKVAYITEQLSLTPLEAEGFWPVYNEFEKRKGDIFQSRKALGEQFSENQESLSDNEISKMLDDLIKLNKEESEFQVQYDKKFREILPPAKVMKLYIAEVQFRHHLINKFREQHDRPDRESRE